MKRLFHTLVCAALVTTASAQLSSNPDKFLGNITTSYQVDWGKEKFYTLWNQITPENETKWESIEGSRRGSFDFARADQSANYAKKYGFPFKFHTLIWGGQYPGWMNNLSVKEQYKAIVEWFDAVKEHYPSLEIIDVVNEAITGHAPAPYKAALGGDGRTGFDWIIKAFEMAHERWPNAILVYNDYNTFRWQKSEFITLCRTLRDAGAPIDAYGCQSHDLRDMDLSEFKSAMTEIQNALKIPMYSTEYDIDTKDDNLQAQRFREQIPVIWQADYCAGITLWGYIYGHTWENGENTGYGGIIKDGVDRPAMEWLRTYMAKEEAKNAKSPFPGFKKEASIYVHPASMKMAKGDVMDIKVRASLATKTIESVELYDGSTLFATLTEAPYIAQYEGKNTGTRTIKAVVTATDGTTFERLSRISVQSSTTKRQPYGETVPELPGTLQAGEYDKGISGVAYSNASRTPDKTATKDGAWMEYTVDVKEEGLYTVDAEIASPVSNGVFHLSKYGFDDLTFLTDFIEVPKTGGATDFQTMSTRFTKPLTAGRHRLCLNIDKGGFYVKSLTFRRYEQGDSINVSVSKLSASTINVGEKVTVTVAASSSNSTIANVRVYANDLLVGMLTEAPYTLEFEPMTKGSYVIKAIATDANGKEKASTAKTLTVKGVRIPYIAVIDIPGVIEAENFDRGGESLSFHDSDDKDEGDAKYRTDNEGVDIVKGNGGNAIGYTAKDEWLEYSVNVTKAGKYYCVATVSSGTTGSEFRIYKGSTSFLWNISVPQTASNSWNTYKKVENKTLKQLSAGKQILRIKITGANCNIDKIEVKPDESTGIDDIENEVTGPREDEYNLAGQKVGDGYRGIIVSNGRKVLKR